MASQEQKDFSITRCYQLGFFEPLTSLQIISQFDQTKPSFSTYLGCGNDSFRILHLLPDKHVEPGDTILSISRKFPGKPPEAIYARNAGESRIDSKIRFKIHLRQHPTGTYALVKPGTEKAA